MPIHKIEITYISGDVEVIETQDSALVSDICAYIDKHGFNGCYSRRYGLEGRYNMAHVTKVHCEVI